MRILRKDLHIERLRRSGPGGQNRNRRASGIRMTHIPTGIVVMATERRSQDANLDIAFERLRKKLLAKFAKKKARKKTKPTRASKERRIQTKKKRSKVKEARRGVPH